jgi:hypothetical protein
VVILFGLPMLAYEPTIFHRFGLRDDYSILREAHEEPGKITRVCSMQARPLYGVLLENSFGLARSIDDLAWIRAGAAILLGCAAVALFFTLGWLGWDRATAALLAAVITILPSAQVFVSWAVAWPLAVAVLLAIGSFVAAERAFQAERPRAKAAWWGLAVVASCASALDYQPNSMFYFALVAAALIRRGWTGVGTVEWLVRHAVTVFIGVGSAFTLMMVAFAQGWVPASHRIALDHDWIGKALWFVATPLQNAFALIAVNRNGGSLVVLATACAVILLIGYGLLHRCRTKGRADALWHAGALTVTLSASFAVNFVVGDRWPVYRVITPLASTVLVAAALALFRIGGVRAVRLGLLALLLPGVWLARSQTLALIARPQEVELNVLEAAAGTIDPARHPRVFVITPRPEDHVGGFVYADEFGSLSTDSDWVSKEMLHLIMESRHPEMPDVVKRYEFACGRVIPKRRTFDVIINLRSVSSFRQTAPR